MPDHQTEMLDRKVVPGRSTLNEADRSVEVCWSTGASVKRYSWDEGYYMEELQVDKKAIRMDRFESMALLDSHDNYSMDSVLGSVVPGSVRIEGGKAYARIRFSKKQRAEDIFQDIRDGHRISISVGYKIHKSEKTEGDGTKLPVIRAIDWEPMELSAVPIPADAGAFSRAEERTMPEEIIERQEQQQRQARPDTVRERTRIKELRYLARSANMSEDQLDKAIDDGVSVEAFRNAVLDKMVADQARSPTFPHAEVHGMGGGDRYEQQVRARRDALYARMTGATPQGDARSFMSASLLDHARGLLEAQGVDTRTMTREDLLGYRGSSYGMHTTSDFPLLLQGAGERVLMAAYEAAQSPLKTVLSRRSTATDFRAKSKLRISDGGLLEKVNESGEIKATTRAEASESYKIDSYARIFALSFQAIVNDDLNAFGDWSTQAGQMAALTENKIMLDLLLANSGNGPKMGEDGNNLFHADHGNLATAGTTLDETNLAAAILAFRKQRAFPQKTGGEGHRIAVAPKYLLVGPELEITAQKIVASISPTTTANAVPEAIKALVPIVEPNLDGKSWRIFADPAAAPVFEHAYLSGHEGVQLATQEGFDRLGTKFRAVLHFGAGAVDFRGAYLNPGL